ncbi:hypothetical protein PBAL39_15464 [Pedobacter sp. BAL39]|uniref:hypothetical protein n=1 Tax=Pedobacter sp. BAL39 TaxID=391596 RepID=UPI0001559DBC|nr:hypothetical protein [Pedobacter sp. BAL39]EDM37836.1 hypothetical protein PBAL39_15464 [Pedobacter sp. BAL39]
MTTYIRSIPILFALLLANQYSRAQSAPAAEHVNKRFIGTWVDKKTTRHLEISFEDGYATIMDWTSKFQKKESGDVYKAFLKDGKLVMPEDTEHHAPYSEILSQDGKLIYLTKPVGIGVGSAWDKQTFVRSRAKP